ncbi:MAG TPA: cytochrome c oxidase subunit 3 family protein [Vicinamibacterales bacterium]|nr:cytochrome c oxidase subunit 3 family protein [Vicinamibacterales bacterium]
MADVRQTSLGAGAPAGHAAAHAEHAHHPKQQHHFYSMEQQLEASILGMWIFLVTEIMFFGGLFMAYLVYRHMYPLAWTESSHELNVILGGTNTAVLICSSLTMVLAVRSAQIGSRSGQIVNLILTILLGSTFLVIKFFEYKAKFEHGLVPGPHFDPHELTASGALVPLSLPQGSQIFFSLYFIMTGIHALHMVVGIGLMLVMLVMAWQGRFTPDYYNPIEVSGLYWHFVDIVWIFLFPLLYLLGYHFGV